MVHHVITDRYYDEAKMRTRQKRVATDTWRSLLLQGQIPSWHKLPVLSDSLYLKLILSLWKFHRVIMFRLLSNGVIDFLLQGQIPSWHKWPVLADSLYLKLILSLWEFHRVIMFRLLSNGVIDFRLFHKTLKSHQETSVACYLQQKNLENHYLYWWVCYKSLGAEFQKFAIFWIFSEIMTFA